MNTLGHRLFCFLVVATVVVAMTTIAPEADAKKKRKRGKRAKATEEAPPPPPPPVPAAAAAPTPAPAAAKTATDAFAGEPTEALLTRTRDLYEALEYDKVLPLANAVLAREDLTPDQKLDAYLLQGNSLAIIGDAIEAEKSYRLLLRGRPDFDLPGDTPPKILAVFRKVQVEENTIREQLHAMQRERIRNSLELIGKHPGEAMGGYPLAFAYRLRDPNSAVEVIRIQYRRQGEGTYSSLALRRDDEGVWRGAIPGEWTSNEEGFKLEFFLQTTDKEGPLLTDGDTKAPIAIDVSAGTVDRATPPPLPLWAFVATASSAAAVGVAAASTGIAEMVVQQQYRDYANLGLTETIEGDKLMDIGSTGDALAVTTNILLVATGMVALAAGVMVPFTNWTGASLDEKPAVSEE